MGRRAFHFDSVGPPFGSAPTKRKVYKSPLVNRLSRGSKHAPVPPPPETPPLPADEVLPPESTEITAEQQMLLEQLKDQICQHSYSLRQKLFKLANERISIDRARFIDTVEQTLKLLPTNRHLLQHLLNQHGQRGSLVSFSAFEHSLKKEDRDTHEQQYAVEAHRFMRPGIMDRKLQKVVERSTGDEENNKVLLATPREQNQLGSSCIQPPFAVMGDSERMAGIISAYLEAREDTLKAAMEQYSDPVGNIAYADFQRALLTYDKCTSQNEMDDLMAVLDPRRKGIFSIDKFLSLYGQEYIKKRSQRSTGGNPFAWVQPTEYDKEKVLEDLRRQKRMPKRMMRPRATKTSTTRSTLHNSCHPLSTKLAITGNTAQPATAATLTSRIVNTNQTSVAKPKYIPRPPPQQQQHSPMKREMINVAINTTSSLGTPAHSPPPSERLSTIGQIEGVAVA